MKRIVRRWSKTAGKLIRKIFKPRTPKHRKLTDAQKRVIAMMEKGTTLCRQQYVPEFFFDGGSEVHHRTVAALLRKGLIALNDDGLVPGHGQTFKLTIPAEPADPADGRVETAG